MWKLGDWGSRAASLWMAHHGCALAEQHILGMQRSQIQIPVKMVGKDFLLRSWKPVTTEMGQNHFSQAILEDEETSRFSADKPGHDILILPGVFHHTVLEAVGTEG